jgi:hypothetical protein
MNFCRNDVAKQAPEFYQERLWSERKYGQMVHVASLNALGHPCCELAPLNCFAGLSRSRARGRVAQAHEVRGRLCVDLLLGIGAAALRVLMSSYRTGAS